MAENPQSRRITTAYKLQILAEVEACGTREEIEAVLRREGLSHATLRNWRKQARRATRRPRKSAVHRPNASPEAIELARLRREQAHLKAKLREAELIIEAQRKLAAELGLTFEAPEDDAAA